MQGSASIARPRRHRAGSAGQGARAATRRETARTTRRYNTVRGASRCRGRVRGWMISDNDGALVAALPAVSDDEAFDKMRDTVEQQVAELGDKVAALAKRYESDCKAGGLIMSLDLAQKQAPSRRQPCAEDGLVIFCEFEGVACSIDTEAALVGEAGGTAEERLKRLQVCMVRTHAQHAL